MFMATKITPQVGHPSDSTSVSVAVDAGSMLILIRFRFEEGRCKAAWKREFKLSWREAGPPSHSDDTVNSD